MSVSGSSSRAGREGEGWTRVSGPWGMFAIRREVSHENKLLSQGVRLW